MHLPRFIKSLQLLFTLTENTFVTNSMFLRHFILMLHDLLQSMNINFFFAAKLTECNKTHGENLGTNNACD